MPGEKKLGKEWHFDRIAIITGVGRSGTSILAKLIGSCRNTLLLYEPAITKFMLHHPACDQLTRNILMEDYFIPMIIGRSKNQLAHEESWSGNFWLKGMMLGRKPSIEWIEAFNPLFIIKTLETQPLIPRMRQLFPGCKVIHAVRHGNSVIGSSLNKGWYTDGWLDGSVVDYVVGHTNCKIPRYMPQRTHDYWAKASQTTRIALVWAYLARLGERHADLTVRYEDVNGMPDQMIHGLSTALDIEPTDLTRSHRKAILRHPESEYRDFTPDIDARARGYYCETLEMLNYG